MKIRFLILILLSVITSCCEKSSSVNFTDTPIVEAYLKPGDYLSVKVSRQIPFSSDAVISSDDIEDLDIIVSTADDYHELTSLGSGYYIDSSIIVQEGHQYNLSMLYNSKTVTAYTVIPSKPENFTQSVTSISIERQDSSSGPPDQSDMPDPVELSWSNDDASYYIVVVNNIEETLDPIRDFGDDTPPDHLFRKDPTASSGMEIRSMDFQYYGTHQLILYHVLPDYASLYDENSTTSLNLTNPSTAIVNGYGIFTGLNADTLYIEVTEP